MKKTKLKLYIIPAYEETIRHRGYKKIISFAKKKGYEIEVLNLQIKRKLLSDLTQQGIKKIGTNMNCVIFGFSVGALVAYNISTIISVKKIVLASTTPGLGSDIKTIWKDIIKDRYFSKATVYELRKMKYRKSKAKEAVFMYGEKEGGPGDFLIGRTKKLYKTFTGKKELVMIKDNEHTLNAEYVKEINKRL